MARRYRGKRGVLKKFENGNDIWPWQIYSFIFGTLPFYQILGDMDTLIRQMIGFVEELPTEWEQQWDDMQRNSKLPMVSMTSRSLPGAQWSLISFIDFLVDINIDISDLTVCI